MANKPQNLAHKILKAHLAGGEMVPGQEIQLNVDHLLMQDALSALTMLALEAMELDRIKIELACQYVDHNLFQADFRNPDDHVFLRSCCRRFGMYYSQPGNGISHPTHQERFGIPGKLLVGTDSHTPAAGAIAMVAIGVGSVEGASILAGEPLNIPMPEIMGVKLTGELPDWVSAKDVILEMLRRHTVKGGVGKIIEYYGPGLKCLSAMDRHVIANMGTELGATTTVFPTDERTKEFFVQTGREDDYIEMTADDGCDYDHHDEIDLSTLEPLIAKPSSPDNVVKVKEVAGEPVYQAYVGSSANPGYRDFAITAEMVKGKRSAPGVSFDVNPSTRQVLTNITAGGYLTNIIEAGARVHQTGCNGCNGMGQAPASGKNSLRTTPRNFPGRSGVKDDRVFLCSPETATAAALTGVITDPRDLGMPYPKIEEPKAWIVMHDIIEAPLPPEEARKVEIEKGPNIASLPPIEPIADRIEVPVALKMDDNISTDTISPAGAKGLPYRSNVQKIAQFSFDAIDENYYSHWLAEKEKGNFHALVAGQNYGQGSSREHAALAPQYLGLRLAIVKGYARLHWQNLINSAVLPLTFANEADYDKIEQGDVLVVDNIRQTLQDGDDTFTVKIKGKDTEIEGSLKASPRQREIMLVGGFSNWVKAKNEGTLKEKAAA
ncbi:MAG: aconitate hydratase [Rhodospirillales bacterium]